VIIRDLIPGPNSPFILSGSLPEYVEIDYSFRTKLEELSDEEAIELLKASLINGREGFFCLKSNRDLTLEDALITYRKKDSIEKIFHSLKNEINIKPLRVWSDDSIYGAIILGFIAQLFISLMRYEFEDLKHISTKFIKKSLKNLTLTELSLHCLFLRILIRSIA